MLLDSLIKDETLKPMTSDEKSTFLKIHDKKILIKHV